MVEFYKFLKKIFRRRTIFEIDSTVYLFLLGIFLGTLIFFSLKALWILYMYLIFLISLILHDLLQIYVAEKYNLKLKRYILYPFASKKIYGKDFENPGQEMTYAIIGLATYIILFLTPILIGKYFLPNYWPPYVELKNTITAQTFDKIMYYYPLFGAFWVNFLLFIFNLLIFALPMDGGRLLKAILTKFFGKYSANKILPYISKTIGIIVIAIGILFWDFIILILGGFIYVVSIREAKESEIISILSGKKVKDFVKPVELVFNADMDVLTAFKKMKAKLIPEAIVIFEDKKFGVIDAEKISNIPKIQWPNTKIGDIAELVIPTTRSESLAYIAQYMVQKELSILPVIDKQNNLLGIVKRTDLADFLKIHKIYG